MKIIKWIKDNAIVILLGMLFFSPLILMMGLDIMQQDLEIKELRQEIADREHKLNANEDYINGWNDCISYLKHIRERATNVTVANLN